MTIEELEALRDMLRQHLFEISDLRPGSIYPTYRRCGKKNCARARPEHRGRLQYLRTSAKGGRNRSWILPIGPEMETAIMGAENYQGFTKSCRNLAKTNAWICEMRPVREVKDPEEFEAQ